jgi:hypothetical protein
VIVDGDIGDSNALGYDRMLARPRQIQNEGLRLAKRPEQQQPFDYKQSTHKKFEHGASLSNLSVFGESRTRPRRIRTVV